MATLPETAGVLPYHFVHAESASARSRRARITTLQIGLGSSAQQAGGAERVFSELATYLPPCGIEFCGAVAEASGHHQHCFHKYAFAPAGAGTKDRIRGARRTIARAIEKERIDLVASHFAMYSFPALDKIRKKPFVVHFHGPWSLESRAEGSGALATFLKHRIEQVVYSRADRVIVLSHAFAELVHRRYGVSRHRIRVIPGSVDTDRFATDLSRDEAREELGWPKQRPIIVAIRRLSDRMGLDLLIHAMPHIMAKHKDVLLYIGGKGPSRSKLEKQVEELRLSSHVKFLGFVPEEKLPLAYRAANLNVVPSRSWEGFGLVAAEALAAGTPSLVTPTGGLAEVVGPLSPNLVFQSTSVTDIAAGIANALTGSLPTDEACRTYARSHFASPLMAERTAAVYRELI